mmetsp:Transcript_12220/g.14201  ORF Transcript_12220/g.14201 Transcript_12220/m.14201 type:complete len:228 (-) Transcript_12220:1049-1732(-)|eukprot:CAMPEP_0184023836 /NCGR_PEP_ID=MMETSP0954-20121128/11638_1 /TAXON_ID=627963 /ORGANISM="Aplanochytrium sp, Strain PBS07" /LENGTH=227 /DNA_ID=CAMNT_0026306877 /DNA_START=16 /DNA_END=699 /DNA_ORIENTATION=+
MAASNQIAVSEKKAKKRKPPPDFYTCKACGVGKHWIFECEVYKKKKLENKNIETKSKETSTKSNQGNRQRKKHKRNDNGSKQDDTPPDKTSVYVTGLSFDISNKEIHTMFEQCGKIVKLGVPRFRDSKRSKGIAFITFADEDMASKCLAMDGTTVQEGKRFLSVTLQKPKGPGKDSRSGKRCYRCGSDKHDPSQCKNNRICYRCRKTDHLSFDCPLKKNKSSLEKSE